VRPVTCASLVHPEPFCASCASLRCTVRKCMLLMMKIEVRMLCRRPQLFVQQRLQHHLQLGFLGTRLPPQCSA